MTISASSMLVELNLSVWTANKLDRTATDTVLISNGATSNDAAQVRKNLMSGTSARKKIADYAAGCRNWHYTRTLPWSDKGVRLLPTSLFFDYKSELTKRQFEFDRMVDQFLIDYPQLVQQAQSNMGSLFNADDYPSVDEVRSKFGFKVVFSPVPESGDFRLDLPSQELAEMRADYDEAYNSRLNEAMGAAWAKLHDMLTGMSNKLTESDADTKKRWHDTFLSNGFDLCSLLTHLNVANDPKLEAARQRMESALSGADLDTIKVDEDSRADLKQRLDAILKDFEW